MKNPYFPCDFLEQGDQFTILCTDFHYFDEYFEGKDVGGYTVERLAKKLVKERQLKGIQFDSEAGMFCAFAARKTPLKDLCTQLRKCTGGEAKHRRPETPKPSIPLDEAERLLLRGFVLALDETAQQTFLDHVPPPTRTPQQAEWLRLLREGTEAEQLKAARRIDSEARTLTRRWDNHLSHPQTTAELLALCDFERDCSDKVRLGLTAGLVSICGRHFPDRRFVAHFTACLNHRLVDFRYAGLIGLTRFSALSRELLKPLRKDRAKGIRSMVRRCEKDLKERKIDPSFPSWMFDPELVEEVVANLE